MSDKPVRLNFWEYRKKKMAWVFDKKKEGDPTFFPCDKCYGKGGYHKPEDRDCIEGYKLAPWYNCDRCEGTGRTTEKEFRQRYKSDLAKWKAEYDEWKRQEALRKSALKKLSKEERKALGV